MSNRDLTGHNNTVKKELAAIDDLEIHTLTDEELNAVAGAWAEKTGTGTGTTVVSCACCCAPCTSPTS